MDAMNYKMSNEVNGAMNASRKIINEVTVSTKPNTRRKGWGVGRKTGISDSDITEEKNVLLLSHVSFSNLNICDFKECSFHWCWCEPTLPFSN